MAKKTLNKKVVDVVFWTSIFLVMYLIVGFLLGSSWLSKGLTFSESYNLLKDGLSITAAFLAPIAAFILFTDWREQHVEQKVEKIYEDVWLLNKKLNREIILVLPTFEAGNTTVYRGRREALLCNNDEIMAKIYTLAGYESMDTSDFTELSLQINKDITGVISDIDDAVKKINKLSNNNDKEVLDDLVHNLIHGSFVRMVNIEALNYRLLSVISQNKIVC